MNSARALLPQLRPSNGKPERHQMRFGRRRRRQPAGVTLSPTRSTMWRLSCRQLGALRFSFCSRGGGVSSQSHTSTEAEDG